MKPSEDIISKGLKLKTVKKTKQPIVTPTPTPTKFKVVAQEVPKPSYVGGVGGERTMGIYAGVGKGFEETQFIGKGFQKGVGGVGVGITKTGTETKIFPIERTKVGLGLQPVVLENDKTKEDIGIDTGIKGAVIFEPKSSAIIKEDVVLKTGLIQRQITKLKQESKFEQLSSVGVTSIPTSPTSPRIKITKPEFNFGLPFAFPGEGFSQDEQVGYQTYVKERGKYKKVSEKPLTRKAAMDLGARFVDNTTSATFKIEPITQTVVKKGEKQSKEVMFRKKQLGKGDGYFIQVANKVRDHVIKHGKPVKVTNLWIEKHGKRADTRGEQQGLTVSKYQSQLRRRAAGVPLRKQNKPKRKTNVKGFFGMR